MLLLQKISKRTQNLRTLERIKFDLKQKLPVSTVKVYEWPRNCKSCKDLEFMLVQFVKKKTALSSKQLFKIAFWYFKE